MAQDKLVVVGTYLSRIEAEMARSALEAAGIESVLTADDGGGQYANLAFGGSGVRLQVRPEDEDAARDVLQQEHDEPSVIDDGTTEG